MCKPILLKILTANQQGEFLSRSTNSNALSSFSYWLVGKSWWRRKIFFKISEKNFQLLTLFLVLKVYLIMKWYRKECPCSLKLKAYSKKHSVSIVTLSLYILSLIVSIWVDNVHSTVQLPWLRLLFVIFLKTLTIGLPNRRNR